jgi:hypothetical protein
MTATTTGEDNVAVGTGALSAQTTGGDNVAIGHLALSTLTTAGNNTAVGDRALQLNTSGENNVAIGTLALDANTTVSECTAVGRAALGVNTTGRSGTGIGFEALKSNTTGEYNVGIGYGSGGNITTGSGNISVNDYATRGSGARIFNTTTESDRIVMGHNYIANAYVKVSWTVTSDERDKTNFNSIPHGLAFVNDLKPIEYTFRRIRGSEETNGKPRYGFKAQDILALEGENPIIIDNEDKDNLKYNGESLVPVLVNAIQELSAKVEELENKLQGK